MQIWIKWREYFIEADFWTVGSNDKLLKTKRKSLEWYCRIGAD